MVVPRAGDIILILYIYICVCMVRFLEYGYGYGDIWVALVGVSWDCR